LDVWGAIAVNGSALEIAAIDTTEFVVQGDRRALLGLSIQIGLEV
jgi:hypothetical protein